MQTVWGELAVRDAHVHFFSHRFFSTLGRQKGLYSVDDVGRVLGWEMPPEDPAALGGRWVAELDRHGVAGAALIASIPGDESSVAVAVERHPQRFHGYFMVNPLAPDAAGRVQQSLANGHPHAICLFPAMHRYSLHDPKLGAILAALRAGSAIFVHCGALSVGVRDKLGLTSEFDLRFSNPVDLHAIALRHPRLRFVIPHFGAGYFREALMVAELCPNVYLDTSSSNRWIRFQEEGCTLESVFRRALEVVGPRRLLFGTDSSFFPRGWNAAIFSRQASVLAGLGISSAEAQAIFGGNLLDFLQNP